MARLGKFMLGGIMGAALGVLFAPKAGKELRQLFRGGRRPALPPVIRRPSAPPYVEPAKDLESRIEVTRQQVEAQLAESVAAPPSGEAETEEPAAAIEGVEEPMAAAALVAPVKVETIGGEAAEKEAIAEEEAEVAAELPAGEAAVIEEAEEEAVAEEEAKEAAVVEEHEEKPAVSREEVATAAPAAEETVSVEEAQTEVVAAEEILTEEETGAAAEAEMVTVQEPEGAPQPAPSGFDREEMKRRIEATRNRLKAKAFDSMVGGEPFVAKEGDTIAEAAPDTGVDKDTSEKIDQLLEEED
jgi:hypothetical protein